MKGYRKKKKEKRNINEKISEIELLKKNYNDTSKDNIELGKILSAKNNTVVAGEAKLLESNYWKTNRSEGNIISHLILRTSQKEYKRLSAKLKITVYKIT